MDALFELVKHLNKGEKTFFTKYSTLFSADKNPVYLKLFKAIDRQNEYDENKLISKMNINNFAYQKHYLYEQILVALKIFHQQGTEQSQVIHYTEIAEILIRKRLIHQAEKVLDKALKLALNIKEGLLLQRVYLLRMELYKSAAGQENVLNEAEDLLQEIKNVVRLSEKQASLNYFNVVMNNIIRKGISSKNEQANQTVNEILANKLIQDETACISFQDKSNRLTLLNNIFTWQQSYDKAYQVKKEFLGLYELHPDIVKNSPIDYISAICNIILGAIDRNKIAEAIIFIKKFDAYCKTLKRNSKLKKYAKTKVTLCTLKLIAQAPTEIPKEFVTTAFEKLKHIADLKIRDQNVAMCYVYLLQHYFVQGDYKKCMTTLEQVEKLKINDKRYKTVNFYYSIYKSIACLETGAFDLAEKQVVSLFKKRNKEDFYTSFTASLVNYLNQLIHNQSISVEHASFKDDTLLFEERPFLKWWKARK